MRRSSCCTIVVSWHIGVISYEVDSGHSDPLVDDAAHEQGSMSWQTAISRLGQVHSDIRGGEHHPGRMHPSAVMLIAGSALVRRELDIGVGADAKRSAVAVDNWRRHLGNDHVLLDGSVKWERSVWCGAHAAPDCFSCPGAHGPDWCNGLCIWNKASHVCQPSSLLNKRVLQLGPNGTVYERSSASEVKKKMEAKADTAEDSEEKQVVDAQEMKRMRFQFFMACCACMTIGFFLAIAAVAICILRQELNKVRSFNIAAHMQFPATQNQRPPQLSHQPERMGC